MLDDEDKATYRWEQGISKTWDSVQEDDAGNLITVSDEKERSYRAKQNRITKSIRRGLIRYLVIALDCSKSSSEIDFKPCRLEATKACVQRFINDYYDQNPISQIGTIITRDRSAQRISELSGNPKNHIHQIQNLRNMEGLASLQNTMLLGMSMLRHIPNYGHRELLLVFSSLSTCDPGDIFLTIKDAKAQKVRISVICLVAEVFICKQMAELTGGSFAVATDATHLQELLMQHTIPPPELVQKDVQLVTDFIYMGFPKRVFDAQQVAFGFEGKRMKLSSTAYVCPRCSARTTDIPTQCCVCNLQLNSSSHIARSHHHLFPVPNFVEYEVQVSTQQQQQQQHASSEDGEQHTAFEYEAGEESHTAALIDRSKQVIKQEGSAADEKPLVLKIKRSATTTTSDSGGEASKKQKPSAEAAAAVSDAISSSSIPSHRYHAVCIDATAVVAVNATANEKSSGEEEEEESGGDSLDDPLIPRFGSSVELTVANNYCRCRGCQRELRELGKLLLRCPHCRYFFCVDCDLFVHDSLHNCPGCIHPL
mmetsp:Transcript_26852/g.45283  ORF Transcript_26852/g.45283 Transcript_26852/m.45283 type:complete len:538 (+) Transcript_26852:61-1674(+)